MSSSNKRSKSPPDPDRFRKKAKELSSKTQPTLFGISNYKVVQKKTKKIAPNQYKVVDEFVRTDTSSVSNEQVKDIFSFKCEYCFQGFKTPNAKGNHYKHCNSKKMQEELEAKCETKASPGIIFSGKKTTPSKQADMRKATLGEKTTIAVMLPNHDAEEDVQKIDNRKGNRGASVRQSHTSREKLALVDNVNDWLDQNDTSEEKKAMEYFMEDIMKDDDLRVGCFERTGCLITRLPNEEHDKKIKPQGMKEGSYSVPKVRNEVPVAAEAIIPAALDEAEAENAAIEVIANEYAETEEADIVHEDDEEEEDDGEEIDDNPNDTE